MSVGLILCANPATIPAASSTMTLVQDTMSVILTDSVILKDNTSGMGTGSDRHKLCHMDKTIAFVLKFLSFDAC